MYTNKFVPNQMLVDFGMHKPRIGFWIFQSIMQQDFHARHFLPQMPKVQNFSENRINENVTDYYFYLKKKLKI